MSAKSSSVDFLDSASATVAARTAQIADVEAAETPSLEDMLKAQYPNIHYHVFDAGSCYWKTRNDYPHYLLYQDGDRAKETLENWQPTSSNSFYGLVDGQFIVPKEIKALGNVPPGSKVVVTHPKVQRCMEQNPAYAQETFAKIDAWFTFDVARNEAHMPGCTMSPSGRTGTSATLVPPAGAGSPILKAVAPTMNGAGGICVWFFTLNG